MSASASSKRRKPQTTNADSASQPRNSPAKTSHRSGSRTNGSQRTPSLSAGDQEITAMSQVVGALKNLHDPVRLRVLTFACQRFKIWPQPAQQQAPGEEENAPLSMGAGGGDS